MSTAASARPACRCAHAAALPRRTRLGFPGAPKRCVRRRITNTREEVWPDGAPEDQVEEGTTVTRFPSMSKFNGPLERKVSRTFEDAIFDERISLEEMEFWFNPSEPDEQEYLEYIPEDLEENPFMVADNPGESRTSLAELQVGAVVRGRVTEVHVYHGLKVDIGAEYDAVVPIEKDAFTEMGKAGEIPDIFGRLFRREVDVRLAQIHDPRRFRWPVVASLQGDYNIPGLIDATTYEVPIFLFPGDELTEVAKETGRPYEPLKFYGDLQRAEPDIEDLEGNTPPTEEEEMLAIMDDLTYDIARSMRSPTYR